MQDGNQFIPAIRGLTQNLAIYSEQRKAASKEYKYLVLGAKLSQDILKAKDPAELTQIMMEGNQIAFQAGVPELANQINNLGRIQLSNLQVSKDKMLLDDKNNLMRKMASTIPTLVNGELVTLADDPRFTQGESLASELQEMFYTNFIGQNAAQIMKTTGFDKGGKAWMIETAIEKSGDIAKVAEYWQTGNTATEILSQMENLGMPIQMQLAIKENEAKIYEEERALDLWYRKLEAQKGFEKDKFELMPMVNKETGVNEYIPIRQEITKKIVDGKEKVILKFYDQSGDEIDPDIWEHADVSGSTLQNRMLTIKKKYINTAKSRIYSATDILVKTMANLSDDDLESINLASKTQTLYETRSANFFQALTIKERNRIIELIPTLKFRDKWENTEDVFNRIDKDWGYVNKQEEKIMDMGRADLQKDQDRLEKIKAEKRKKRIEKRRKDYPTNRYIPRSLEIDKLNRLQSPPSQIDSNNIKPIVWTGHKGI